jgi:O-antigen ligase
MADPDLLTAPRWRVWSDRSVLAFLGFGFIVAPEPTWAAWFYVVVMPLGAWSIWRGWRLDWRDPRLMLLVSLIAWSTLTLLWADHPGPPLARQWLWVWNGLCTATFLLAVVEQSERSARARDLLVLVVVGCGAANAVFSISAFLIRPSGWDRLEGWAETRNAILGASIMGTCAMFALGQCARGGKWWLLWGASVPVFLLFIVLTGSRGPLLAVVLSSLVFLPKWPIRNYALAGLVVVAVVLLIGTWQHEWVAAAIARAMERGTSYRLDIWREALAEIARRPLFGHGPTAGLHIDGGFGHHPHNLYLSAWYYSGAIGLGLLLAGMVLIGLGVWRLPQRSERRPEYSASQHGSREYGSRNYGPWEYRTCLALLVHAVLSGMTDLSQIIKGPGEVWYIIWLPLAFILAVLRDPAVAAAQSRTRISENAFAPMASPGKT